MSGAAGDDRSRLLRALALSRRFHLYLARCESPRAADELACSLGEELPSLRGAAVQLVRLDPYAGRSAGGPLTDRELVERVFAPLLDPPEDRRPHGVLHLVDVSKATPADIEAWARAFALWNEKRNAMQQRLGGEVLVLLPVALAPVLPSAAPDVWSIRSGEYDIRAATTLPPPLIAQLEPARDALHRGPDAVLPVVGAGLSHGLLPWAKLLEQLVALLERDDDRAGFKRELGLGKDAQVAQDLERMLDRSRVAAAVARAYQRPQAPRPPVFELLAGLPAARFAATSCDPWLKDALAERLGRAPRVCTPDEPDILACLADAPLVLMLHGDADRPETCVLSQHGDRTRSHFAAYRKALAQLASTRSLLFVGGVSLDEWHDILGSGGAARHWFLATDLSESAKHRLLERGVVPIELGKDGDASLLGPALRYLATSPDGTESMRPSVTVASAPAVAVPEARPMRWLHLSDLRVGSEDGYGHDTVLRALVEAFHDGGTLADRRPDVIFCTGDLALSGKAAQYVGVGRVFEDLCRATGVPMERVLVVPGNHDVDRARVGKLLNLDLSDRDAADFFFGPDGIDDREFALRRFAAFAAFQGDRFGRPLSAAHPCLLARCRVGAEVMGVLGLNTAWLAPGKLVVGERLVRQALAELESGEPLTVRVALLHHPLDRLADFERDAVKGLLYEGVDFVLHGPMHAQRPEVVSGPQGIAAVLASGVAYQGRMWPSSALLVELSASEARAEAISFQGIWMRDELLAPRQSGVLRLPRRAPPALGRLRPPSTELDTSAWLRRLENETRWADLPALATGADTLRIRLDQVFIPPRAHLLDAAEEPLVRAMSARPFVAVVGEPGCGKTTLLRYVAHQAALGLSETALPLLVPLEQAAALLAGDLNDALVAWAAKARVGLPEAWLRSALAQRRVRLLLDGLDEIPDPAQRQRVSRAVSEAALALATRSGPGGIVVTCRPAAYGGSTRLGPPFVEARVLDFGHEEVRRFLDRWVRAARGLPFEGTLEGYPEAARQLGELEAALAEDPSLEALSRTPLLLTVIALVYHPRRLPEQPAALYDELVEVLLRRFGRRSRFEPPVVRAHLAAVAWQMTEQLHDEAHEDVVIEVVARRMVGLPEDSALEAIPLDAKREAARMLDEQALTAGLLRVDEQRRCRFVHRIIQEYLAAWRLAEHEEDVVDRVFEQHLGQASWRETLRLTLGVLVQRRPGAVERLSSRLEAVTGTG